MEQEGTGSTIPLQMSGWETLAKPGLWWPGVQIKRSRRTPLWLHILPKSNNS